MHIDYKTKNNKKYCILLSICKINEFSNCTSQSDQHCRRDVSMIESSPTNVTIDLRTLFELVILPKGTVYTREQKMSTQAVVSTAAVKQLGRYMRVQLISYLYLYLFITRMLFKDSYWQNDCVSDWVNERMNLD